MANILFQDKVSPEFVTKVSDIAYKLGVDVNWLQFIINYETSGTFDPTIQNKIGATGLFQFLPSTAIGLGTTTDALKNMSAVDQLDYGYELLGPYQGKMTDYYSTYLGVFYPAALGQPDTYVFPAEVVRENPSFFVSGNTLADFKTSLDNIVGSVVPDNFKSFFFTQNGKAVKRNFLQIYQRQIIIGAVIIVLAIILWQVVKHITKK